MGGAAVGNLAPGLRPARATGHQRRRAANELPKPFLVAWKTDVGMSVFGAVLVDRDEQVQGSEHVHWAIARWVKLDEPFALLDASCLY